MTDLSHPAGETPVPFIDLVPQHNAIADEVMAAVGKVFAEQRFVMGDEVVGLEKEIAAYCDAPHAIACNSGTDALLIALQALDVGPGDEVITTPFSFFATASAIVRAGATPVFADIDPKTYNLDPAAVEAAVTPRTKAIIPVHLFGQCCNMDALGAIAQKHGLAVVEDACQAIGAEYRGKRVGTLGTVGCFSFFPTKNLGGAGDGGMMTCEDAALAQRLGRLRVHGAPVGQYEHTEVGMNSRLDALQAAVLRVKLRHLESWTIARQHNARQYAQMIGQAGLHDTLTLPTVTADCRHVFNQYCVRVKAGRRDEIMGELRAKKVGCMVYYPKPLHLQTCFADLGYKAGDFPVSETVAQDILALPIYPELPADHHARVVDTLIAACRGKHAAGVRKVA